MALTPGTRIGHCEILGSLGAGGMGEVYRARDTRLQREVALKILPAPFATDPERLARFTREAQTLASVNHPNIAAIYGIEESNGVRALVMELVEGPTLDEVIREHGRPPSPSSSSHLDLREQILPIARQIADALEAAHDQGIVHRDLKPANIKVRPDGTVKVLDFGLAKALDANPPIASTELANSPTFTAHGTQVGMILGTASYMAPEQARGRPVDRRADVWAFGVVLFELLTGRRAFEGEDISEVLASVLKSDPNWSALPADVPPALRRLLRRCLEKDPRKRLSAIGDARFDLNDAETESISGTATASGANASGTIGSGATSGVARSAPVTVPARMSFAARWWPALAGALVTAIAAAVLWPASSATTGDARVVRTSIVAPAGVDMYPDSGQVAISPDGTMVAFIDGNYSRTESRLWIRQLDSMETHIVEGSDHSYLPFWSPDSRRIAFFVPGALKVALASGGRSTALCDAASGRGGTWNQADTLVFARDGAGPLYRVSANGGEPVAVTTLDTARKESAHRFPAFLPDGVHFLFATLPSKNGKFDIFVGSLNDSARTPLGTMETSPLYVEPGYLLALRQNALTAQPFDPKTLKITSEAVLLPDVATNLMDPGMSYTASHGISASTNGMLAYFSASSSVTTAKWMDIDGRVSGSLNLPPGLYSFVRISPDGKDAVFVRSVSPTSSSLWLSDLSRGSAVPFSSGPGRNDWPVWSRDGKRVVWASDRDGPQNFYVKEVGDAAPERPFYQSDVLFKNPSSFTADGASLIFAQVDPGASQNIYMMPASGTGTPQPLVKGPLRDLGAAASPDGKWFVFLSEDTGRMELFVQAMPGVGRRVQITQGGALNFAWTRDGRALLYTSGDWRTMSRADLAMSGNNVTVTSNKQIATLPAGVVWLDAMPDLQKFIVLVPEKSGTGAITVVQNWLTAMRSSR